MSQSIALQPGDIYFEDVNGDGVVDDNDKTVIGNPHPKFTYGLNLSGSYKDFDMSASFNGSYGNKVLMDKITIYLIWKVLVINMWKQTSVIVM